MWKKPLMKTVGLTLIVIVYLFVGISPATAETPDQKLIKARDMLTKTVLMSLDQAQQMYRLDHGAFTDDLTKLTSDHYFSGHKDVDVMIDFADGNAWKGKAQHKKSPNVILFDSEKGGLQD